MDRDKARNFWQIAVDGGATLREHRHRHGPEGLKLGDVPAYRRKLRQAPKAAAEDR